MKHPVFLLILFTLCVVKELFEIISFEKKEKHERDKDYIKLFRQCHWTYLLIFAGGMADSIISIIEKLS